MTNITFIDYDKVEKERISQNVEHLLNNLDDKELHIKISNFAKKYCLSTEFVKQKIIDDNIFALQFIKDPIKQGVHQTLCADFIKNFPLIDNFEVLPANGKNAVYVLNGMPVLKQDLKTTKHGKSIDFKWTFSYGGKELAFYGTHKHTRGLGGGQDNQYHDLLDFLDRAADCSCKNTYYFAIADGDYYLTSSKKTDNMSKMDYMNTVRKGLRSRATNANHLLYYICIEIKKWLIANEFSNAKELIIADEIITYYEKNIFKSTN